MFGAGLDEFKQAVLLCPSSDSLRGACICDVTGMVHSKLKVFLCHSKPI